jgi:hypothetical protein
MSENLMKPVTRRDFVRGTLGTAVTASVVGSSLAAEPKKSDHKSRVVVVRDRNALQEGNKVNGLVLKQLLEQTLTRLTGKSTLSGAWQSLLKIDDVVGLVPTSHLNPTHKELIEAVETSLQEAGFSKDRIRNAQGKPSLAEGCTALVALPGLKAHWLTGIGTVLKNYIMFSGKPSAYHAEHSAKLGEIWNLPCVKGKTKLVLVDALRPLCDKGPQVDPRYLWGYNGLIAGTDPVAVETVCLEIIAKKREALRGEPWPLSPPPLCVAAADEQYHLGTSKLEQIQIDCIGWEQDRLI